MTSADLPSIATTTSIAELDAVRKRVRTDQNRYAVTTPLAAFGAALILGGAFMSYDFLLFPPVVLNALALPTFVVTAVILSRESRKHGLDLSARHYRVAAVAVAIASLLGLWIFPGLAAAVALVSIGIVERRRSVAVTGALVGALGMGSMVGWPYTPLANAGLLPDSLDFEVEGVFFVAAGVGLVVTAAITYLRSRRSA